MKIEPYQTNWFFSPMIPMLASRPGSWFFSHTLHIFDRLVLKLSRGRRTLTELLGGAPVITLTTIGAKSGIPRSVPLMGFADGVSRWGSDHSDCIKLRAFAPRGVVPELESEPGCDRDVQRTERVLSSERG